MPLQTNGDEVIKTGHSSEMENAIHSMESGPGNSHPASEPDSPGGMDQTLKYVPVPLRDGERIDDLQRSGYGIIQKSGLFGFGMDAVLLSGFAAVREGEMAVDLGTGTGILPILLEAKTKGKHFAGVEIQEEMADMAARSVRLNRLEEKIDIYRMDLRDILTDGGILKELLGHTDAVTSNPPYMKAQHGLLNPEDQKALSRHEICCTLEDVCAAAARLLRSGGRFYMVHRPQRLAEIIPALQRVHLEPKRLKFVHPFPDAEANLVLIEAVKDARSACRIEKPVIVYRSPGVYTEEIYSIYGY